MNTRIKILLSFLLVSSILIAAWVLRFWQTQHDVSLVSVSTDREVYSTNEPVQIHIQNLRDKDIDLYCPEWCALGNFPTTVERFSNGQWEYFAGFCPSIEPLFGSGVHEGEYIRHTLAARSSFNLELTNFQALKSQQAEVLRIVYYLGPYKVPIYSNEFTIKP